MLLICFICKVELTLVGSWYLEWVCAILVVVDEVGAEVACVAVGEIGWLAIGFMGSAMYDLLLMLARVLCAEFFGIELDFRGEILILD